MYYINYFFMFSIFGHFIESFFYKSGDSGILISYWTPIYGIGVVIILLINKFISKFKINKVLKIFILFLMSSIVLAITEVIGGYIIKYLFNKELWNYSNHLFNIGKYTSVEMAILWGTSSLILIYIIKPLVDKIINKIPKYLTYILIIFFVIDVVLTIIKRS